jgi:Zn-dependent protease/predicted transcriptional regulator
MHAFFLVVLVGSIAYGVAGGGTGARGFALWLMLVVAVLLREAARALAAACYGLDLRNLLLLPTGALATYGTADTSALRPDPVADRGHEKAIERRLALVGPLTNIVAGGILAGLVLAVAPEVNLYSRPWVSPAHLLRSFVWVNVLLGMVNLLPTAPLDGGRIFRSGLGQAARSASRTGALGGVGQMIAVGLVLGGVLLGSVWFIMIGFFVLLGAHMENQGLLLQTDVDTVTMRDVMLTDYTTLSASDTLEDALERAVHTLQDVFPVVRGGTIVGAVSRQGILEALQAGGNSYVQGVMAKTFDVAHPEDALVKTLRRIGSSGATQFVPVLEGETVVGIVTPHHLSQSIRLRGHVARRGRDEQRD